MGPAKGIKVLLLVVMVGVLGSAFGLVRTASAATHFGIIADFVVTGSGSAGSGSLAVAAIFPTSASTGVGAFSGVVGGVVASGLFSLTVINPANAPVLPCAFGEASAGGTIVSGNDWVIPYIGDNVLVAGCIGSGVAGAFVIYHVCIVSGCPDPDFSGSGTGTVGVFTEKIRTVGDVVAAGVTSGLGSAGPGNIYAAEADGITSDGRLLGGGAFVGTISDVGQGNTWVINRASLQSGCTLNTSGLTGSFGSFPNLPVSSSYTLVTCPPSSLGPQTARFVYAIGGDVNPIYSGTGAARLFIQKPGHIQ